MYSLVYDTRVLLERVYSIGETYSISCMAVVV